MEKEDYYLKLLEEYFERCRQVEDQREKAQGFIITISLLVMSFVAKESFSMDTIGFSIVLIFIGIFGAIVSLKYKERFEFQHSRAKSIRKILDKELKIYELDEDVEFSDEIHKEKNKLISSIRLYVLWVLINIFIALTGIVFLFVTLV